MLAVERRADHLYFFDVDDPAFFSATIHQPEASDRFEVNIGVANLGDGPVANFAYSAPTLYAAGQTVTSEYHVFLAVVEPDDEVLAADYWLDQLDGGTRWRSQLEDEEDDDDGTDRITKLVAWLTAG